MPTPVLVVHREQDFREPLLAALAAAGHEAVGVSDSMVALDTIEGDTRVRVLVTQMNFGKSKLNGVALACMLRLKRPGIRVVFVGASEDGLHTEGIGTFFPEPPDPQALVDRIGFLLGEPD